MSRGERGQWNSGKRRDVTDTDSIRSRGGGIVEDVAAAGSAVDREGPLRARLLPPPLEVDCEHVGADTGHERGGAYAVSDLLSQVCAGAGAGAGWGTVRS